MAGTICVLVDGDNISARHATTILQKAQSYGGPRVARVYMDAQRASDWHSASGYRVVHAGVGKNAADLLLTIDAMEFFFALDIRLFLIATSDGDFSHLAARLRERGATVIGMGETKAPRGFRASCSDFREIGRGTDMATSVANARKSNPIDLKIRGVIAAHSQNGSGMRIVDLSPRMHRDHGVTISSLPEKTWRAYLTARPTLYVLDPRGPEAKVRYRPDGFAALT